MSIFLENFTKISETQWRVGFQHNLPLDPVNGVRNSDNTLMTADQLNQIGVLVNSVPEPVVPSGQQLEGLYYNPQTKELSYQYVDKPVSDVDKIASLQQALLEAQNTANALMGV